MAVPHRAVVSIAVVLGLVGCICSAAVHATHGILPTAASTAAPPAAWSSIDGRRRHERPEAPTAQARGGGARSSKDGLVNGAVIGAAVGAATLAILGASYCRLYQEPGGPSCRSTALGAAAIGATIGMGAGLAVDAALERSGVTIRMRVRF